MPSPATVHAGTTHHTGTAVERHAARLAVPVSTRATPTATKALPSRSRASRAWIHEPAVHEIVVVVRATPVITELLWRALCTVRGRYVSAPKKANVSRPRLTTVAGRPRSSRREPDGNTRP